MSLSADEVTRRTLTSVSNANPGWLNDRPVISHPSDQAQLATALLKLRERGVKPSGNDVGAIFESLGWPTNEADHAGRIADLSDRRLQSIASKSLWAWQQSIVDTWFEGDE